MTDPRFAASLQRVADAYFTAHPLVGAVSRQQRRASERARSKNPSARTGPCQHPRCVPAFDEDVARDLDAYEVRRRWPRFDGTCPDCGERMILYASWSQYILGDY